MGGPRAGAEARPARGTRGGLALGLVAAVTLSLAACVELADQPPAGFSLAGTWKLNPQLSTDTRVALQHIVPRQRHRPSSPSDEDLGTGGPGAESGPGGDNGSGSGRRRSRAAMQDEGESNVGYPIDISLQRSLLSGGDYLKIQQRPDEFVVWNGDTTNSYVPGEKSVVSVPNGVADQKSGWKGKEYRIEIRPQIGPSVTEKFRLSDDGKRLIETIDVASDGRVRKLDVTRVYDPTSEVPTIVPAGD